MPEKLRKKTNPYLKDTELGKALLYQSVSSSTAVEGVLTKYPKLSKTMGKKLKKSFPLTIPHRLTNNRGKYLFHWLIVSLHTYLDCFNIVLLPLPIIFLKSRGGNADSNAINVASILATLPLLSRNGCMSTSILFNPLLHLPATYGSVSYTRPISLACACTEDV